MTYKTLYRVFRPSVFDDVYGRAYNGCIEKPDKIRQAFSRLPFLRPQGNGKTSTAKIFANALNCLSPEDGSPCGECEVCREFKNDNFVDIIEIDAASNNGVDNVRDIREKATLLPASGKYKVYIIDEVHMLSQGAFNALLKTLEEPPAHAVFILATTEQRKVPATISSRCQKYDFKRLGEDDILARLEYVAGQTGVGCEREALELITKQAEGAMRDALSIMDQCIAGKDTLRLEDVIETMGIAKSEKMRELADAVNDENTQEAVSILGSMFAEGTSPHNVLRDLIVELSEDLAANARDAYKCSGILRSIEALIAAQASIRYSNVPDAVLTAAVVRAAVNTTDTDMGDIGLRLKKLEDRVERLVSAQARGQAVSGAAVKTAGPPERAVEKAPGAGSVEKPTPQKRDGESETAARQSAEKAAPAAAGPGGDNGGAGVMDAGEKLKELKKGILMKNMALFLR
jgi:DNA polymerase-3 subunit gamma/tau